MRRGVGGWKRWGWWPRYRLLADGQVASCWPSYKALAETRQVQAEVQGAGRELQAEGA